MARHMAVDVDCTWHACNMGRQSLDIQADCRRLSAESLRSDAKLVDLLKHLFFQVSVERVRVLGIDRTHQRFLR